MFLGGGWSFLFGMQCFVSIEQAIEDGDGGAEVVAEGDEQVDVVEVFLAGEAVGEVVAWVDGGAHFAAAWAEEAEVAFAHFRRRPVAAEGGDGDGHRQVVAQAAQQFGGYHGLLSRVGDQGRSRKRLESSRKRGQAPRRLGASPRFRIAVNSRAGRHLFASGVARGRD